MRKFICTFIAIILLFVSSQAAALSGATTGNDTVKDMSGKFYTDHAVQNWYREPDEDASINALSSGTLLDSKPVGDFNSIVLSEGSELSFTLSVPENGVYNIIFEYRPLEDAKTMDTLFDVRVSEDEKIIAQLPILWSDSERYAEDRYQNQLTPRQEPVLEFVKHPLVLYSDFGKNYAAWELKAGEAISFRISSTVQPVEIKSINLSPILKTPEYSNKNQKPGSLPLITIEGEAYAVKSDSYIRGAAVKNASLSPYDTYKNKINVLDGGTWKTAGQKILWEFKAEESGYYRLGLRYKQNDYTNKKVYRKIELDGRVPFSRWQAEAFSYTGTTGYKNTTLQNGNEDTLIYLKKGLHTLAMTAVPGAHEQVYNDLQDLMDDINETGLLLLKITAGSPDKNRTWDMSVFMPNAAKDIKNFAKRAEAIYKKLEKIEGTEPRYATDLIYIAEKLKKLTKEPEKIPNKTEELCRGDDSATKYIGNIMAALTQQSLNIDRIYLYGQDELPRARISFFKGFIDGIKRFVRSFFGGAAQDSYSATGKSSKELQVWVGQSAQVVGILQQMVDEQFNKEHGTKIRLSIMPNEQKLILSNAAGTNPDVVLSAGAGTPFTFAVRGALKNLLDYKDFLPFYSSEYQLEPLVSTSYAEGVYGAVDSRNFQLLFYRSDILEMLGAEVPDTWDDVRAMIPSLLRNQMNFYISISSGSAMKGLGTTSPFIYQNGAQIYSDDGREAAINSENAVNAITEMTEFYKIYGMQKTVASFYNSFRYGEIPIGIGDFNTYLQLSFAAPDLAGKWEAALSPGTKQENGEIVRFQPANNTASSIFKNTKKPEEAWSFLKWWLGAETQRDYSQRRMISFGPEYQWNTANLKAFAQLPLRRDFKQLVLKQWEHQREVTPHPASYIVERGISGVWNDVVIDNKAMMESIDKAVNASNREIRRKLEEFGYIDSSGKLIKDYNTKIIEMLYAKSKGEE